MSRTFRRSYNYHTKSWTVIVALIALVLAIFVGMTMLMAWLLQVVLGFFGVQLAYWQALLTWGLIAGICTMIKSANTN